MIGYITLGTNDLDRARGFYGALLGATSEGAPQRRGGSLQMDNSQTALVGNFGVDG